MRLKKKKVKKKIGPGKESKRSFYSLHGLLLRILYILLSTGNS